jgi:hypothetical protein
MRGASGEVRFFMCDYLAQRRTEAGDIAGPVGIRTAGGDGSSNSPWQGRSLSPVVRPSSVRFEDASRFRATQRIGVSN